MEINRRVERGFNSEKKTVASYKSTNKRVKFFSRSTRLAHFSLSSFKCISTDEGTPLGRVSIKRKLPTLVYEDQPE